MKKNVHVGLIYGGRSPEHEVSIASAHSVFAALDAEGYRVTPIRIDRAGRWHAEDADSAALHHPNDPPEDALPEDAPAASSAERSLGAVEALGLDVAFPVLHGPNGEDGRIQGLLCALGLPYVGAGVLASAVCMDKDVAKRLLRDAGLPVVPFRVLRANQRLSFGEATGALGPTLFIKPAGSGSSVGTSKAESAETYDAGLAAAFAHDTKVLVETAVAGREIECAVIGNEEPRAAVPGEIVATADFYTYEAKYDAEANAAHMEVPADLPEALAERVRAMAVEAYRALGCEGMARVDFFLTPEQGLFVNEINTIPGFTARSMFPVMWKHAGLPLGALVGTLIDLALDRHARDARLKTTR